MGGSLEICERISKARTTFPSPFYLMLSPVLSPRQTKENLSLPHLSLSNLESKRRSWRYLMWPGRALVPPQGRTH